MKRILIVLTSLSLIAGFAAATPGPVSAVPAFSTYGPGWGGSGSGELVVSQFGNDADTDSGGTCASPDFNSINEAVSWAEEELGTNTTIFICNGIYYEQIDSTIGLYLVGEHRAKTILDGSLNDDSTVFVAGGSTEQDISVQDLTFRNGDSSLSSGHDGGALWAEEDVYCYNSVFTDNFAEDDGGAIFTNEEGSGVYVTDCTFTGNDADYGGAIRTDWFESTRSSFIDNYASVEGGAVYTDEGFGDITDSLFEGNYGDDDGGAIYTEASNEVNSTIYRTTFKNNSTAFDYGDGGAIWIDGDYYLNLQASTFIGNRADDGGAIYLCADDSDNELWTTTAGRVQTTFQGNVSDDDGGAIFQYDCAYADLRLTNARFLDNVSDDDGGAVYLEDGNLYVTGSTFTGNRAEDDGGAIEVDDYTEIRTSTFTRNTSETNEGGAISICADMTVTSSTFTANSANDGGAIDSDDCGNDLTIEGSTFVGNVADSWYYEEFGPPGWVPVWVGDGEGGAISGGVEDLLISRSTFRNNSATDDGGAVNVYGDTLRVLNSTFTGNMAEEAGALFSEDLDLELRGNLFQSNKAFGDDETPNFTWSTGAVMAYFDYSSSPIIRGNRFVSNTGWGVGALYLIECEETPTFDQAAMRANTWRSNRVTGSEPQGYRDVRTEEGCYGD